MALPKKLQAKIEKFLADKKKSSGGWAPVDDGEIEELENIVYALIEAKYEKDPDGDLPVSAHLTDRTRFKLPVILPIPHTHSAEGDVADMHEAISRHMTMAASHSESAKTLMQLLSGELKMMAKTERPVRLEGKVYRPVPTPNEGVQLTQEWFTTQALKRFTAIERKNPCPTDWQQRDAWGRKIVEELGKQWGVFVSLEACRITTQGLSVSLRIPAIDRVVRFNVGSANAEQKTA
jgi:hypothetical protein